MLVLLGGEPGVGKSTLALQAAAAIAAGGRPALYVSGEESKSQIRMRGERLGLCPAELYVLADADLGSVEAEIDRLRPAFTVIDSIQTLTAPDLPAPAGSIAQVRECAVRLLESTKARASPVLLVGHITKEGMLAGPKTMEHIVDTVLSFEGDSQHLHRVLRCTKNRFGPADEVGMFAMTAKGLESLANPSEWFLRDRQAGSPGSAVTVHQEGSRPFLVEVQALAGRAAYGTPRRACVGVDSSRVSLLVAVLERRSRLALSELDLFVNAAGGVRLQDPAADLAVACALASALTQQALHPQTVFVGEIGLAGEIRSVPRLELRLREAARRGFTRAVLPRRDAAAASAAGLVAVPASSVDEALSSLLELRPAPGRTRPAGGRAAERRPADA
jgi:DNA repair protein RadA/Sms